LILINDGDKHATAVGATGRVCQVATLHDAEHAPRRIGRQSVTSPAPAVA
jgi:hypothetical protein